MTADNTAQVPRETKLPALAGGGKAMAIVPQDFESAWRLSQVIVAAGIAPKGMDTVEKCCVAIMHGLEVGLPPMAAVQSIASINGRPCLWGDAMLGLVRSSGLLESIREEVEREKDGSPLIARCTVQRKGNLEPTVIEFTRVDAQRAKLWTKEGPWTNYPARMMKMRARSWALRDTFPDVLKGLYSREEAEDMADVTGSASVTFAEPRRSDFTRTQGNQGSSADSSAAGDKGGQPVSAIAGTAADGNSKPEAAGGQPDHTEEQPPAKVWRLPDDIVGQENIIRALHELVDMAESDADLEEIEKQNAVRIAKFSQMKRSELNRTKLARSQAIAKGEA